MAEHNLETLLFRIRDGVATADEVVHAGELVRAEPRLSRELREVIDFEDAAGDAAGLLAVLGADSLFGDVLREGLALEIEAPEAHSEPNAPVTADMVEGEWSLGQVFSEAIAYEGGTVELVVQVFAELGLELEGPSLAEAVCFEAGEVELTGAVLEAVGAARDAQCREHLVAAIASEAGTVELADAVVEAVEGAARLPLMAAVLAAAGDIEIADAVLGALGLEVHELPVAAAIRGEAGAVDVRESVEGILMEVRFPLAAAIASEAGTVDVWPEIETVVSDAWVSALLDHQLAPSAHRAAVLRLQSEPAAGAMMTQFASIGRDLRTSIQDEAGECPYIWAGVAQQLGLEAEHVEGWDGARVAAAVRSEAGVVDVVDAVAERIQAARRPTKLPYAAVEVEAIPMAANNRRFMGNLGTVLMAMVVLVVFGVVTNLPSSSTGGGPVAVETTGVAQFASADEIVIEELNYGDHSNVQPWTGDDGALILWVDEGATL